MCYSHELAELNLWISDMEQLLEEESAQLTGDTEAAGFYPMAERTGGE